MARINFQRSCITSKRLIARITKLQNAGEIEPRIDALWVERKCAPQSLLRRFVLTMLGHHRTHQVMGLDVGGFALQNPRTQQLGLVTAPVAETFNRLRERGSRIEPKLLLV